MSKLIETALQTADQTNAIAFSRGAVEKTGEIFQRTFPGKKVFVVADQNTFAACGEDVVERLFLPTGYWGAPTSRGL
ncbi:MAG: hypothetical protein Q4A71_06395 [Actinomycetaceae bacterium]|nr:hypothetical protein [Actinomycetaceae bacterium]